MRKQNTNLFIAWWEAFTFKVILRPSSYDEFQLNGFMGWMELYPKSTTEWETVEHISFTKKRNWDQKHVFNPLIRNRKWKHYIKLHQHLMPFDFDTFPLRCFVCVFFCVGFVASLRCHAWMYWLKRVPKDSRPPLSHKTFNVFRKAYSTLKPMIEYNLLGWAVMQSMRKSNEAVWPFFDVRKVLWRMQGVHFVLGNRDAFGGWGWFIVGIRRILIDEIVVGSSHECFTPHLGNYAGVTVTARYV